MDPARLIFLGGIIPGAVALLILLIGWRPWQKSPANGHWASPLAIVGALAVGYFLTQPKIEFPPADSTQWLVVGTLGLAVLALVENLVKLRWSVLLALVLIGNIGLIYAILFRQMQNIWTARESVMWVSGLSIASTAWTILMTGIARSARGVVFSLGLAIVFGAAGAMMLMNDSAVLGQIGGMLTAGIAAFVIVMAWSNNVSMAHGVMFVAIPAIAACMVRSYLIPSLRPIDATMIVIAGVLLIIPELPVIRLMKTWKRIIILLVVLSIPLASVMVPTTRKFIKDMRAAGEM